MKVPVGFGNINPRPTADILFSLFFKSDAAWNKSAWKNERFDQLLVASRAETDEAKRKQMYYGHADDDPRGFRHRHPGLHQQPRRAIAQLKGLRPMPTAA